MVLYPAAWRKVLVRLLIHTMPLLGFEGRNKVANVNKIKLLGVLPCRQNIFDYEVTVCRNPSLRWWVKIDSEDDSW